MDCSTPGSSVQFPRQEYWSGLPFPFQGIFLIQAHEIFFFFFFRFWRVRSLIVACKTLAAAYGIWLLDWGLNLGPLHWERGVSHWASTVASSAWFLTCVIIRVTEKISQKVSGPGSRPRVPRAQGGVSDQARKNRDWSRPQPPGRNTVASTHPLGPLRFSLRCTPLGPGSSKQVPRWIG